MCSRGTVKINFVQLNLALGEEVKVSADAMWKHQDKEVFQPGDTILSIIDLLGAKTLTTHEWGIEGRDGQRIANARADKLTGYWRDYLHNRRCVVPFTGFYECSPTHGDRLFSLDTRAQEPMLLAGVHNPWGQTVVVTTEANVQVKPIHHRMPVILSREQAWKWVAFDPHVSEQALVSLLKPYTGSLVRSQVPQKVA